MIKKHLNFSPYIFSSVTKDKKEYIVPFDNNGIPMDYDILKSLTEELTETIKNIEKEEYLSFQNSLIEREQEKIKSFENSISEEQKIKKKKSIEKFDFYLQSPIMKEKDIENKLSNKKIFQKGFIDSEDIKYPIIITFYKNNVLVKTLKCFDSLMRSISYSEKKYDFDSYSYFEFPKEFIDQVFEYIIIKKNPLYSKSKTLTGNPIVYSTINRIRKRVNIDRTNRITTRKILDIIDSNNISIYLTNDHKEFVNARLLLEKIGDYLSGIKRKDF